MLSNLTAAISKFIAPIKGVKASQKTSEDFRDPGGGALPYSQNSPSQEQAKDESAKKEQAQKQPPQLQVLQGGKETPSPDPKANSLGLFDLLSLFKSGRKNQDKGVGQTAYQKTKKTSNKGSRFRKGIVFDEWAE